MLGFDAERVRVDDACDKDAIVELGHGGELAQADQIAALQMMHTLVDHLDVNLLLLLPVNAADVLVAMLLAVRVVHHELVAEVDKAPGEQAEHVAHHELDLMAATRRVHAHTLVQSGGVREHDAVEGGQREALVGVGVDEPGAEAGGRVA